MLNNLEETALYELSDRLNVEVYMVGVGAERFLPEQYAAPTAVATAHGSLAEWVIACLDDPEQIPWWIHTHPKMSAFFSPTDVTGAHELFAAIRRPIFATVLGKDGEKYEAVIDEGWCAQNPKPLPPPPPQQVKIYKWGDSDHWDLTYHEWEMLMRRQDPEGWAQGIYSPIVPTLGSVRPLDPDDSDLPIFDPDEDDLEGNLRAIMDGFGKEPFFDAVLALIHEEGVRDIQVKHPTLAPIRHGRGRGWRRKR